MKFTIVTPSYNTGKYIERTIQSVLSQSGIELEYFVIDNESTDETIDVLSEYSDRIQVQKYRDRGQYDAINRGWSQGTGDVFAWLNADDVYLPDALKQVADYFTQNPEVMAVYGEAVYIDRHDQVLKPVTNIRNYSRSGLRSHDFITQPATFLRREVVEATGELQNYRYAFDWDYWIRVSDRFDFVRLPYVLAGYRITGDNLTTNGSDKRFKEILAVVWKYGGPYHMAHLILRLLGKYTKRQVEIPAVEVN
ncbi:MAG: glycosyltransferase [Alkalinema sp. RU_4_3]|nr:glycosyltransferase [Alkalinema sp. RU_4_3]